MSDDAGGKWPDPSWSGPGREVLRRAQTRGQKMQGDRRVGAAKRGPIVDLAREKPCKVPHRQRRHRVVARDDRHQRIERQNAHAPREGRILRRLIARGQPFGRVGFPQAERDVDLAVQEREKPLIGGAGGTWNRAAGWSPGRTSV
jgi:hypothetical protein